MVHTENEDTMKNDDASNNQTEEKKEYDGINFYQGQTDLLKQIRDDHQYDNENTDKQNGDNKKRD